MDYGNFASFLLDPLNLTGIQNLGSKPQGAPAPAPSGPPLLYPGQQPNNLNLGAQPPPGVAPVGNADGRTFDPKKGFMANMGGFSMAGRAMGPHQPAAPPPPPSWSYVQGKGPVFSDPNFKGNKL